MMKVSELIKKLSKFDANADVYINDIYDLIVETKTEYHVIESNYLNPGD